ncbi:MAG: hypothetical protein IT494_03185 [Gammaproteobacteria bacterium]|nr:hypothetical protein [Gammaproteobacteria bacterium]
MAHAPSSADLPPALRFPLLALGFITLGLGVLAGLARLGWSAPLPSAALLPLHGPLMVSGFFGVVIGLERAVALGRRWAYLAPLLSTLGMLLLGTGVARAGGVILIAFAALILVAATWVLGQRQPALHTRLLVVASGCWLVGTLLWGAAAGMAAVSLWWMAFLVLTIAAERLELSRVLRPSPQATRLFVALVLLGLAGTALGAVDARGWILLGASQFGLALWLLRHDIARRTVRQSGLTRFIAVCLLTGYVWLAVSGVLLCLPNAALGAGLAYDAALHAVLVGFVFSMVFGHAPIIFPAVTRLRVRYSPVFYFHLVLLHLSLVLRLAGDLALRSDWRSNGGLLNAVALVLFVVNTILAIIRGRREN